MPNYSAVSSFNREVTGKIKPKSASDYKLVGKSVPRVDIPEKVTGEHIYLHNLRLPGMLHGRVIRPATVGAKLVSVDEASIKAIAGVVKVVAKGKTSSASCASAKSKRSARRANSKSLGRRLKSFRPWASCSTRCGRFPATTSRRPTRGDVEGALGAAVKELSATYQWPYQLHASMGPSCAVADVNRWRRHHLVRDSGRPSAAADRRATARNRHR